MLVITHLDGDRICKLDNPNILVYPVFGGSFIKPLRDSDFKQLIKDKMDYIVGNDGKSAIILMSNLSYD